MRGLKYEVSNLIVDKYVNDTKTAGKVRSEI